MNLPRSRSSVLRAAAASVLATAALAAGSPGVAHANAGDFSVHVTVRNNSSYGLTLSNYNVTEGVSTVGASDFIAASDWDYFKSESDWDQGGTAGRVKYIVSNGGFVVIYWTNPYEEDSTFNCLVPNYMTCSWDDNQNTQAEITFTVS